MTGFWVFVVGLVVGSFTNAAIPRWIEGESMMTRSHCRTCGHKIAWYDNIPIFSFLLLRGKCRHCRAEIPLRYPFIEGLMGFFFLSIYSMYGLTYLGVKAAFLAWAFILGAAADVEYREIPDEITIIALVFAAGSAALGYASVTDIVFGVAPAVAMLFGTILFEKLMNRGDMLGGGDLKFLFGIGAAAGAVFSIYTLFAGSLIMFLMYAGVFIEDLATGNRTLVPMLVGFCGAFVMAFLLGWVPVLCSAL